MGLGVFELHVWRSHGANLIQKQLILDMPSLTYKTALPYYKSPTPDGNHLSGTRELPGSAGDITRNLAYDGAAV